MVDAGHALLELFFVKSAVAEYTETWPSIKDVPEIDVTNYGPNAPINCESSSRVRQACYRNGLFQF
jgi:hypothetical protein